MAQNGQQLKSTKLKKFSQFICNSVVMIISQNNRKWESILEMLIGKSFQNHPYKIELSCHSNNHFLSAPYLILGILAYFAVK